MSANIERVYLIAIRGARHILRTTASAKQVLRVTAQVFGGMPESMHVFANYQAPSLAGFDGYDSACNTLEAVYVPADEHAAKVRRIETNGEQARQALADFFSAH